MLFFASSRGVHLVRHPASGYVLAPVAQLAARRSHNPKVASSILAGSILFSFLFSHSRDAAGRTWATLEVPRLSVGWPSGPRR